jgi:hypothetical protein
MEHGNGFKADAASTLERYFRNSYSRAFGAPIAHENWFLLGARASRPQDLADTDSFPKQESRAFAASVD